MKAAKVKSKFNLGDFLIALLIPLTGGFVVGFLNSNSMSEYMAFDKPFFFPPAILFPIVWTILYVLMGIASYRIWRLHKSGKDIGNALLIYSMQLLLNFLWSFIFFKFKLYGLAFIELIILLLVVIATTIKFFKLDKTAALLMLPYIIWLIYAAVLNFYIWYSYEMFV